MFRMRIFLVLVAGLSLPAWARAEITPSEVFAKAVRLGKETNLIKSHLGIAEVKAIAPTRTQFLPRHS